MKGQIGLETLFVFGFLILIFLMAFSSYLQRSEDVEFASNFLDARNACDTVRDAINRAHTNGFNSAVRFDLPERLGTEVYNITVNSLGQSIFVRWEDSTVSCTTITRNVTNSTHNFFVLSSTTNEARNQNGIVVVQKI